MSPKGRPGSPVRVTTFLAELIVTVALTAAAERTGKKREGGRNKKKEEDKASPVRGNV